MKHKFSESGIYFELDTEKDLGGAIESSAARELIANDLIDAIIKRAEEGYGVNKSGGEVKLKSPYSKSYADSLEFQAWGKKQGEVNLQLTGAMLNSIEVLESTPDKIRIGIVGEEAPKAYNHQVGDTVPKRPFMGATNDDLKKIKSEYKDEIGRKENVITVGDILDEAGFAKLFEELSRRGVI